MGYVVGVDSGATKTEVRLLSPHGLTIAVKRLRGFNAMRDHHERFHSVVSETIKEVLREHRIPGVDILLMGVAGARERERNSLMSLFKKKGFFKEVYVFPDYIVAHYSAFEGRVGVVVVAGTGSVAYGFDGKRGVIKGALGPLLDDPGSAFFIGKRAFQRILCGKTDGEVLKEVVSERDIEGNLIDYVKTLPYSDLVRFISALAPHLIKRAEKGQTEERKIVDEAVTCLVEYVKEIFKVLNLDSHTPVSVSGGLFGSTFFFETFKKTLKERMKGVEVSIARKPQSLGAAMLAMRMLKGYKIPYPL